MPPAVIMCLLTGLRTRHPVARRAAREVLTATNEVIEFTPTHAAVALSVIEPGIAVGRQIALDYLRTGHASTLLV